MMQPMIITAAITGAETTREMNPHLPITPEEQGRAAAECVAAGASIIHLHVRDDAGNPTQSLDRFREAIEAIREECDPQPIIQLSTGGAVGDPMEQRIEPLTTLGLRMCSLNIASMNFGDDVFLNPPRDVVKLASLIRDQGVLPEVEIYDAGHLEIARRLVKQGLLAEPVRYQFVLGVPGGLAGRPQDLSLLVNRLDANASWAVAGIGRYELPCAVMAIIMGGDARVGFEDNVFLQKGVLAKSNAELVERVARIAKECGRTIATPDEARTRLGIHSSQ